MIRNSSLFHQVLINSYKSNCVSTRYFRYSFNFTSHHQYSSLNTLNVQVVLGSWCVVGAHDSDFLTSLDLTREDSTECVESTFVISGHHLRDEDHKGTVLITVLDGSTAGVIDGALIEIGSSVSLGYDWGG